MQKVTTFVQYRRDITIALGPKARLVLLIVKVHVKLVTCEGGQLQTAVVPQQ